MVEPQEQSEQTLGLTDYLRVVRERWWIILLAVIIVVGAALAISYTSTSEYRASSKLLYQTNDLDKALFGSQYYSDINQTVDVATGAEMVKLPQVAEAVKNQLGTSRSTGALLGMIDVTSSIDTNIIEIRAVSTNAQEAADLANAFAREFTILRRDTDRATVAVARDLVMQKLDSLDPQDAASSYGLMLKEKYESLQILEAMQNGGFTIVQTAVLPSAPFAPQPLRNGIVALAVGLILGFGIAFLLSYLDRRLKDVNAVERAFGVPVLATVPAIGNWRNQGKAARRNGSVGFHNHPSLLESFRVLRSSLQYFDVEGNIKTIVITSGLPREGKTTTTVNLALSLALAGQRVIIVEADLRRPMVPDYLHVGNRIGLSTVLAGGSSLPAGLQPVDLESFLPESVREKLTGGSAGTPAKTLYCLPSGPLPPNPAELLGSERMARLIEEVTLNTGIDYVLIDTPPVLAVADALAIAPKVDAVIIASRVNWTVREDAMEVSKQLHRSGARIIGVVAGGVKSRDDSYRKRGYYYR